MPYEWQGTLEKLDDNRWRIPKTYQSGMRVPGIIYASDKLIDSIRHDKSAQQVANAAHLPGIVRYSLAMPDMHWGYGLCLTKDARILSNFGFHRAIEDFARDWPHQQLKCIDLHSRESADTSIAKFMKFRSKKAYRIATKNGYEIKATEDHPVFTEEGMRPLKELLLHEKVGIHPFMGVPYERPSNKAIIIEKDIRKTLLKIGRKPGTPKFEIILEKLRKRELLFLTYDHPKIPYILKIMGFIFGDGSMNFIGKRGDGVLNFVGKAHDLEQAREDLKKIGYTPGPVHSRRVRGLPHNRNKCYTVHWFCVNASSLVVLLQALGVPRGAKVSQPYRMPKWIFKAPLWQKRLFLASLFGCELRIPHRRKRRKGYFNAPVFPMAKSEELITNGKCFLKDISNLLKEFGVRVFAINKRRRHVSTKGTITWALELIISPIPENLLNLWGKIGFEYNRERTFKAQVAVHYIRMKKRILEEKFEAVQILIPTLLKSGLTYHNIALRLAGNPMTPRFIMDACYRINKGESIIPRIPKSFSTFEDYLKKVTKGIGHSGMVWDEIEDIEEFYYNDYVYDFTVSHSAHNFIADNFVVSNCIGGVIATDVENSGVIGPGLVGYDINCGVRLIRTDLDEKKVSAKIQDLVSALYSKVPAGVGSTSNIRVGEKEERKIMVNGSQWAVENGFGTAYDITHTEEGGCMEGADPDKVSERAHERGKRQSGTLGSGNHFTEVQVIDKIFDEEAARAMGLELGLVTIMVHCGSRGFGYQICDDYSKGMIKMISKYNITVPDRQLAAVPVKSPEGQSYLGAMKAAANYAWNNRQCLTHRIREAFESVFQAGRGKLGMSLVWDVAHNIAKLERYDIDGKNRLLCVHRKGATRAFGPENPALPHDYRNIGQPVIIPGDMGTHSYMLVGTKKAEEETFGSTCHGAGRVMSRKAAISNARGRSIVNELREKGIVVMAAGRATLAEEMPDAYKDVNEVVEAVHNAGISKKVCRMRPLGVVKG